MAWLHIIWDLDEELEGNVRHISEHGISKAEVAEVLADPVSCEESRSSGQPVAIGVTATGRAILVVYERIDVDTVYPITAYELEE